MIVTGAGSGIGRAAAINAVAAGLTVAADRRILSRIPLHRMATPDEISWAILFLLSPLASYINGILLTVDGGWTITQ